ncbi:MAG: hypothetical protein COV70_01080 [Parcubacteria group bacterium CG11_big_fil_rev_8_21_14_0_20_39_22]|nr:MAG: hypothetical protein COV70_01080 [Parcubacteria group bacterium CG11_big_fil_rev_8_21_14_0_20_39_22]
MNTKTDLQKNKSLIGIIIFSVLIVAILALSFFGIRNAYAEISTQLDIGDRGSEVTELQTYLATNANIYPEGLVTGYYGQLTKAAVERFQTSQGIVSQGTPATTGYGRVGPMTQASINAKLAGGGNTNTNSGDVYAPTIKSVNVNTDNNGASITWTASEASMGKVYYSTSPIRISNTFDATGRSSGEPVVSGTLAQHDGLARVTHTVNINNLASDTTYYYLVAVFDSSKNVSWTTPDSFRIN